MHLPGTPWTVSDSSCVFYGKKSPKFNCDCTICHPCRSTPHAAIVSIQRAKGHQLAGRWACRAPTKLAPSRKPSDLPVRWPTSLCACSFTGAILRSRVGQAYRTTGPGFPDTTVRSVTGTRASSPKKRPCHSGPPTEHGPLATAVVPGFEPVPAPNKVAESSRPTRNTRQPQGPSGPRSPKKSASFS